MSRIRWFKNGQEISTTTQAVQWEQRFENTETSLIARSIRREDAGQYACEIENAYGSNRALLPLVVQCKSNEIEEFDEILFVIHLDSPEIDRTDPNRNKAATDSDRMLTAELHCFVSAVPKPTVIWMRVSRD